MAKQITTNIGQDKDLLRLAIDTNRIEKAIPIVGDTTMEEIAAAAFGEESLYMATGGELVIPFKRGGLRAQTKSGRAERYEGSQ